MNPKTGQIETFILSGRITYGDQNASLRGKVLQSYCGSCHKTVDIYNIEKGSAALLKKLIPERIIFTREKIDSLKEFLDHRGEGMDLGNLKRFANDRFLLEKMIGLEIEFAMNDLRNLENALSCIHLPACDYNLDLDGNMIDSDACPGCGAKIYRIKEGIPCPECSFPLRLANAYFLD